MSVKSKAIIVLKRITSSVQNMRIIIKIREFKDPVQLVSENTWEQFKSQLRASILLTPHIVIVGDNESLKPQQLLVAASDDHHRLHD